MAFGKTTFTLLALVSATALVTSVGCSDDTTSTTLGTGGSGATGGMGAGATGGGGNGTGAQGGGTGGGATTDCETYCTDNITNCTDTNVQYATSDPQATCEAICSVWDQGSPGEMQGDTVECRAYHTGAAASDAATHCGHGGPFGNAVCGASQCETFCAAAVLLCTGGDQIYANEGDCMTDCNAFAGATTAFVADPTDTTNSFACRGYHLTAAATEPAIHCQHAGGPGSDLGDSTICVD